MTEQMKRELIELQLEKLKRLLEYNTKTVREYEMSIWLHEQELLRMDEEQ